MTTDEAIAQAREHFHAGNLIEAGFVLKMLMGAPENLSPATIRAARIAFFFGAQFMLTSMTLPEDGWSEKATQQMILNLQKELANFAAEEKVETAH